MIINIRGTSGSGKSTLVREVMSLYDRRIAFKEEGRRRPLGYVCYRDRGRPLAVLGHYETDCGGCDTIPKLDRIFELVGTNHEMGRDVLFEGLLVNSDRNRTIELDGLFPLIVVTLNTSIETCLASVNERRQRRAARLGKELGPVNPRNTETKHKLALKNHEKFTEAGLATFLTNREGARQVIEETLQLC